MTVSETRRRLSTGHEVDLPLELGFSIGGVTVPARRARLDRALPDELAPLSIAPGVGCVALVAIQYHRVGGDNGIEPYDEVAAIVPTVRGGRSSLPLGGLFGGEIGGYVHWLAVPTEESVALGRELWGYPKERAAVTVTDGPRGIRAVVGDGRSETVRIDVARPQIGTRRRDWRLRSFTTRDRDLVRTRVDVEGEIAIGPPVGASVSVGPDAAPIRELGPWQRPLTRLYGSRVRARLFEGDPVDAVETARRNR
ncbi:acetoacetate decarboxylase family protein [Halosolutus gelatinilyticus]|uniref:acetoacetate decarboxylase family protein n=1 Tax=Halosolutus gelatinilyticus TaxID=2931975 RepID=UPI001FF16BC0|nr:acetoacetate decarboxylase family protein [Halosolutus gelatinilyticus]